MYKIYFAAIYPYSTRQLLLLRWAAIIPTKTVLVYKCTSICRRLVCSVTIKNNSKSTGIVRTMAWEDDSGGRRYRPAPYKTSNKLLDGHHPIRYSRAVVSRCPCGSRNRTHRMSTAGLKLLYQNGYFCPTPKIVKLGF